VSTETSTTPGTLSGAVAAAPPPASKARIDPRTFAKRTASWVALWLSALLLVYHAPPTLALIFVALFGLAGQWEFYRAQEEKGHKVFKQSGLFCGALIYACTWYFLIDHPEKARFVHFGLELVLVGTLLGAFIRLVVMDEANREPITTAALSFLGLMYVPFLFNFVALLAFMPGDIAENRFLLVYLLAVTKFADVGAYVIGSVVGRHKMIPRISPGKTWEGFAGAILTSLAISVALALLMDRHAQRLSLSSAVILGVLLPLISVVGDLAESVVKRDASIKDSGHTIPGIGGALDLIDSILFTAPVLYFYLQFTAPVHP